MCYFPVNHKYLRQQNNLVNVWIKGFLNNVENKTDSVFNLEVSSYQTLIRALKKSVIFIELIVTIHKMLRRYICYLCFFFRDLKLYYIH